MARPRRDRERPTRPSPEVSRRAPKPRDPAPSLAGWVVRAVAEHDASSLEPSAAAVASLVGCSEAQVRQARASIAAREGR